MKKIPYLEQILSMLVVFVFLLTACAPQQATPAATSAQEESQTQGQTQQEPTPAATSAQEESQTQGQTQQEPITLEVQISITTETGRDLMQQLASEFEQQNPNIKVEISYVPWENHRTATLTKIASGNAPDILHSNSNQGSVDFNALGAFVDLGPLMDEQFKSKFISVAFDEIGTYGLPYIQSPEASVFYRTDMFKDAGIEPPPVDQAWTWDQMIEAAQKLTVDKDGDGTIDQWGFAERGKAGFIFMKAFIPYGWSYGSDIMLRDGDKWVSGITTPGMQQAIKTHVALARDYQVRPEGYINWGLAEAIRAWCDDQVAMINTGMWWAAQAEDNCGHKFMENYDVMLFPTDTPEDRAVYTALDYFHITKQSKHPEEAFKFLQFLFEDKILLRWLKTLSIFPRLLHQLCKMRHTHPKIIRFGEGVLVNG